MTRNNTADDILNRTRAEGGPVAEALTAAAAIAAGIGELKRRAANGDAHAQQLLAEARDLGINA